MQVRYVMRVLCSYAPVRVVALSLGLRFGIVLAIGVIALAVIGLTPAFSWVPEVPLVGTAIVLPIIVFAVTGSQAAARTGRWSAGALAGAVAGSISGGIGGMAYVVFGKPMLNIVVGLALGAIGGAIIGSVAAITSRARQPTRRAG